jgi:hypothetical protein
MSISAITSAVSQYVRKITSGGKSLPGGSSALEEAKESSAVTAREAANGDRQAIAKIARLKVQAQAQQSAPAKEPGKGEAVDKAA